MSHSQSLRRLARACLAKTYETKRSLPSLSSTSQRCYHVSRFNKKRSEEIAQSKELHQQMKQVMGAKSAPSTAEMDKARKARFRQSAINVGVSFMTVVLAGQALKSGSERRKMEKKLYEATEETEKKIRLLKNLMSEATVRGLAQKVSYEVEASSVSNSASRGWFRLSSSNSSNANSEPSTEELVYNVLITELRSLIGDADQSASERDRAYLEKLQQEELALAEQLLKEQYINPEMRVERVGEGETVIKKRVLRM